MKIVIREIHPASAPEALNDEWFVLENQGERPFSTAGCTLAVGKAQKGRGLRAIGQMDPGFTVAPGERVRVITGSPGKKAHGPAPAEEGAKNYHLFLSAPILQGRGSVLAVSLKQLEVARAVFDPAAQGGIGA